MLEHKDYTEVFYNEKQRAKLVKKLKSKNFERHGFSEWSETWVNYGTEETVTLVRA